MQNVIRHLYAILLVISITATGSIANATILVDNLSAGSVTPHEFYDDTLEGSNFALGAGSNYNLTSVTLDMRVSNNNTGVTLRLYSDNAGMPGSSLLTLTNPGTIRTDGFSPAPIFTAAPGTTLLANHSYWLVLSIAMINPVLDDAVAEWNYTTNPAYLGTNPAAYFNGAVWNRYNPSNPYLMSINATEDVEGSPVPEPGTFALLGIGLLGYALYRRQGWK